MKELKWWLESTPWALYHYPSAAYRERENSEPIWRIDEAVWQNAIWGVGPLVAHRYVEPSHTCEILVTKIKPLDVE